ncbi:hypothetical protein TNCV_4036051 [Trichonephila clavipes]|nr:hypothetical protein TNCV_4036051 [Trichonephila clavipes]
MRKLFIKFHIHSLPLNVAAWEKVVVRHRVRNKKTWQHVTALITSSRKQSHVTHLDLMEFAAMPRALNQELEFVCKTNVCTNRSTFAAV